MGVPGGPNNANEGLNFWGVPFNPFTGPALGPRTDNFSQGRNFFGVPFNQIAMQSGNSLDDMLRVVAPIGVGIAGGPGVVAGINAVARAGGGDATSLGGTGSPPTGGDTSGMGGLLALLLAGSLGNQQQSPQTAPAPSSDPFSGQNMFAQNPFSGPSYGGISPIGPLLQTTLARLAHA